MSPGDTFRLHQDSDTEYLLLDHGGQAFNQTKARLVHSRFLLDTPVVVGGTAQTVPLDKVPKFVVFEHMGEYFAWVEGDSPRALLSSTDGNGAIRHMDGSVQEVTLVPDAVLEMRSRR